jgi:hypothetical protein
MVVGVVVGVEVGRKEKGDVELIKALVLVPLFCVMTGPI